MTTGAPPPTFDEYSPRANAPAARKEAAQEATMRSSEAGAASSRASARRTEALLPLEVKEREVRLKKGEVDLEAAKTKLASTRERLDSLPAPEKLDEARDAIIVELQNAIEAKKLSRDMFSASGVGYTTASTFSGSPASSVNALLEPIFSNTAFNRIQKMRQESPTGGALGAVSDKELSLLKSSEAALDPAAGDTVFQKGLDTVIGNRIEALMKLGADPLELARIVPPEDLPTYKDKFRAYRFLDTDVKAMNQYMDSARKSGTYDPADFAELMGQAYYNATGRKPNDEFLGSAFETGVKYMEKPDATLNAFDYAAADEDIQKRIGSTAYEGGDGLTWGETLGGAALNFVPSTFELAYDTVYALTLGLPSTIDGVVDIVGGATGLSDDASSYEALKEYYSDRYGSIEGFKNALRTDPASIMADVAGVMTGGATILAKAGSVASKVSKISALSNAAKAAETFGTYAAKLDPLNTAATLVNKGVKTGARAAEAAAVDIPSRFAGTTPEAVKQGFDAGKRGSPEFKEYMSGTGDATVPLDKAEKALGELYQQRSSDYTRRMAGLKRSDETLEFADVEKAIEGTRNVGRHKGIDISAAADVWDEVDTKYMEFLDKGLNTIEDFDAMKRAIKTIGSKYQPGTPQFKVANDVSKAINDVIVKKAPVYAGIMKDYRQASDILADIKATLSLGSKSPDTALNKLRRNAEGRTARGRTVLDLLEQTPSGKGLGDMLAGAALSSDVSTGFGSSLTGPAALMTGSPEVLSAAMITPKSLGEKAYQMGQVYGPVERAAGDLAQTQKAQAAVDLAQKYGPDVMAAIRTANPVFIQPQMDPAATAQSFRAEDQPTPEGYIAPFPNVEMGTPDALRLEKFYGAPEAEGLNLNAFRVARPAAAPAGGAAVTPSADGKVYLDGREVYFDPETEQYMDVESNEVVQGYARGGLAQAPIALGKGGQPSFVDRARSFAKGATFAFNDEMEAGLRALAQLDSSAYRREVSRIRAQQTAYENANHLESLAYEMGGSMLPALVPGGQVAVGGRMASLVARAPRAFKAARDVAPILRDAVLYGAGSAENVRDIPRAMGEEAAFGLGMYGASRLAKKPAKAVARKVRSMFR